MFTFYENKLKKIDYDFKLHKFFNFIYISFVLGFILISTKFNNIWLFFLIYLLSIIIICIISIHIYILFFLKKEKIKSNKIDIKNNLKLLYEISYSKKMKFFINFLKENHIDNKEKILLMYNEYKQKNSTNIVISGSQSLFVIVCTIINIYIQLYNIDTQEINTNLLSNCVVITICCITFYYIYNAFNNIIRDMFFSNEKRINEKFERLFLYFYLHFEEYEDELKK